MPGQAPGLFRRLLAESSFLRHYAWKYRKLVGIGLLALVVVDGLEILPPILLKDAVDVVTEHRPLRQLGILAGAYLLTALVQGVGRYGWRMYLVRASMYSGRDLREKYATHLFRLSVSFFDRRRVGDLMSFATSDVDAVRMALGAGLLTFADALFFFTSVPVAMYLLSPRLTLLAFLPLPILPFFVARSEREIHARFRRSQEAFSKLAAMASENLGGIRVIKAFAREDVQREQFAEAGREFIRRNLRLARVQVAFGPTLDFTMSLGLVALLWIGGRGVIEDAVTLGTFVAFQRYIQKMVWPMAALGMAFSHYQRAVASSDRLKEVFAQSTDVPEPAQPKFPEGAVPGGIWRTRGGIELRQLTFRFPGVERDALAGLNLTIAPGERVALVGGIGSGKSALLSLIPRLYPVARGMLLIDGVDVNDWDLRELRAQVGYVSQEVFLFSETVTENVAYGLAEWASASDPASPEAATLVPRVHEATGLASVHEDVRGLVRGYDTRLGERGVNLSGGQKQRLTIARAVAMRPPILVLDDALAAVDVQTEERILSSLRARPGRNTELIAAHRISTVKDADRIVVLHQGRIQAMGTHAELLRDAGGIYAHFHRQQRMKEDLEHYLERLDAPEGEARP
jgi:ATP-binding cassette subfamily B protein